MAIPGHLQDTDAFVADVLQQGNELLDDTSVAGVDHETLCWTTTENHQIRLYMWITGTDVSFSLVVQLHKHVFRPTLWPNETKIKAIHDAEMLIGVRVLAESTTTEILHLFQYAEELCTAEADMCQSSSGVATQCIAEAAYRLHGVNIYQVEQIGRKLDEHIAKTFSLSQRPELDV